MAGTVIRGRGTTKEGVPYLVWELDAEQLRRLEKCDPRGVVLDASRMGMKLLLVITADLAGNAEQALLGDA